MSPHPIEMLTASPGSPLFTWSSAFQTRSIQSPVTPPPHPTRPFLQHHRTTCHRALPLSAMTDASKTITSAELAKHTTASDCWMVIEGKVYNVTEFLDEHPGGEDVLLAEAGKDATEAFDDVGHSDDARHLLVPMLVGNIEASVRCCSPRHRPISLTTHPSVRVHPRPRARGWPRKGSLKRACAVLTCL